MFFSCLTVDVLSEAEKRGVDNSQLDFSDFEQKINIGGTEVHS